MSSPGTTLHRILVVDDNRAIHEDFRKILGTDTAITAFEDEEAAFFGTASSTPAAPQKQTFELDFASQGNEALEKVRTASGNGSRYSVVFMDVRMPPGWDGIETTARLWKVDPDLQVVICTAYSDYSWEEMIRQLGYSDRLLILKKPFDPIEVLQFTHALTGKWTLMQGMRRQSESLEQAVQARTAELKSANALLEKEIAERERSEEALRFTQFSVDYAADSMFWVDPAGRLLYVNVATCRSLGYDSDELRGSHVSTIAPDLLEEGWEYFWNSLLRRQHQSFESQQQAKDGRLIPVELTLAFFDFGGRRLICASARDITRRKQILAELSKARDAAIESVRLKGQFLANMSHEIRTPMNGVIGMAHLLLHTNLDREQREYVDTIRSSSDSLLAIINDILDSSKIESGQLTFQTLDFDLIEVLEDSIEVVASIAQSKGIELAGGVLPDVCRHLRGDSGRLRQVITNIVGNAVKFTERGEGIVTATQTSSTPTHTGIRFEVRDTGIGISPEMCQRVFEPFVQADGSDTRKYGGTGLGLSICRQIVEALGGQIGVESEQGKGTTFWFTLNFEKQAAVKGQEVLPDSQRLRTLVVAANESNRGIIGMKLGSLGLRSSGAGNPEEALALLRREATTADPFLCAVVDMNLAGNSGLDLSKTIKADPLISGTKVLLMSSMADRVTDATLATAGAEDNLAKPLKHSRLQRALAGIFTANRATPSAPTAAPLRPVATDSPRSLRILLAEDNPINQKVSLMQLASLGYTADVAINGIEAVSAAKHGNYDLIFMDCQMPVMDGYTATQEIRRSGNPVRIVAMTANAMHGEREKCLAAGMNDYLSKPVRAEEIQRVLEKHPAESPSIAPTPQSADALQEDPVDLERLGEITCGNNEMLRRLCHDYIEQADEILAALALALERRSLEDIRQLSHKLGGSSSSCGMRALVQPLAKLEQVREISQLPLARDLHQDTLRQISRIRRFLTLHLESVPS